MFTQGTMQAFHLAHLHAQLDNDANFNTNVFVSMETDNGYVNRSVNEIHVSHLLDQVEEQI